MVSPIWAAGFIDGEGCFTVRASGQSGYLFVPVLQVSQKFQYPLIKLQELFGGNIHDGRHNVSKTYMWYLHGKNLKPCLEALQPHLILKQNQCDLLLSYIARMNKGKKKLSDEEISIRADIASSLRKAKKEDVFG